MQAYAEHMKATRPRRHDISVSQSPEGNFIYQKHMLTIPYGSRIRDRLRGK